MALIAQSVRRSVHRRRKTLRGEPMRRSRQKHDGGTLVIRRLLRHIEVKCPYPSPSLRRSQLEPTDARPQQLEPDGSDGVHHGPRPVPKPRPTARARSGCRTTHLPVESRPQASPTFLHRLSRAVALTQHCSTVHFAATSTYSSLSSTSDSGSEYSAPDSDSGWIVTPMSSQEVSISQFSQRLNSSTSSLEADSDYLTDREGRPRPPTPKPSQTGAGGQPLRTTRTLRKEDTLMVIDTTQRTSAD